MSSTYWDSSSETFKAIPDAPYYVLSHDPWFSNWGVAEHTDNTVVVPCQDREQAEQVVKYEQHCGDQERIRITRNKPRNRAGVMYSLITDWAFYKVVVIDTRREQVTRIPGAPDPHAPRNPEDN